LTRELGGLVEETEVIARLRTGDPEAQRGLYDAHVDRVYRLAYRMTGDDDLAQEFTQDTFIRAFDRIDQFRGESAVGTWIYAIAARVVMNGMRKIKRFRHRQVALDEVGSLSGPPPSADPDLRAKLRSAIDALPEKYRMVFVMHDIEGYTHREIAGVLGVQTGTSKAQLSRARARLRDSLAEFAPEWAV
jgi:RNA polymerase sigma-70 factor (ECF subfamily)